MSEPICNIRLSHVETIEVCPHITIGAMLTDEDCSCCEYTDLLTIYCKVCNNQFQFVTLIN